MNGLYGYPSVGSTALSGMAGISDEAAFVWSVATGELGAELKKQRTDLRHKSAALKSQEYKLSKLSAGQAKTMAEAAHAMASQAYDQTWSDFQNAAKQHNNLAAKIKKYTAGVSSPSPVGLSAAPLVIAAWVAGFVVIASGAILAASVAYNLFATSATKFQSVFQQATSALEAAGGAAASGGIAMTRTAWAVIAVVGTVLGYQLVQDWRRGKRSGGSTGVKVPPPVQMRLKTVAGEVL